MGECEGNRWVNARAAGNRWVNGQEVDECQGSRWDIILL